MIATVTLSLAGVLAACGSTSGNSSTATAGATAAGSHHVTVGIFLPAEAQVFVGIVSGFEQSFINTSGLSRKDVSFDVKNADGQDNLIEAIARQFNQSADFPIGVIGTPALLALRQLNPERPLIAIAMTDPVGQKVANTLQKPGLDVTGSTDAVPMSAVVGFVSEIKPKPRTLGTIFDPSNSNIVDFTNQLKAGLTGIGVKLVEETVSTDADVGVAARSLTGRTNGIILGPDILAANTGLSAVTAVAKSTKTPLYLAAGADPSTPGITAVLAPNDAILGKLAGDLAGKVFKGAAPGALPFARLTPQLQINAADAKAVGVTLPSSVP